MAGVAPPADQAADLLKNLSLDPQNKTLEIPEPTKKPSVDSGDNGNGQIQPYDRSMTPLLQDFMDPAAAYYPNGYASAYFYGAYDGTTSDWDEYTRYGNPDGVDMSHGSYGDNGSLMYHGYGYAPYGPYSPAGSPVPQLGPDGQLYGAQHYQYPTPYFQPMTPTSEISTSAAADQVSANGAGAKGSALVRPKAHQGSPFNANGSQNVYQDPRYGFDGVHSPIPWLDASITSSVSNGNGVTSRNQNAHPHSHLMSPRPMSGINAASGYMNRMYPDKLYGQYGSTYRSNYGYGSNAYDNKYKPRGRGNSFFGYYNNENGDGLNELNRGPRGKTMKNPKASTPITIAVKGEPINLTNIHGLEKDKEKEKLSLTPDREQYNLMEFSETYADAKFFVIKSYSEDDVHKSIKYNVWSSTQNGNKKLDAAYQDAQQKPGECPIFLLFSVNASGQFVGVAEMVGPVDFEKSVEYWQQDKWIGCFPVKWHIVKDLPNTLLKHIIIENNENKPVTNSRDTQEIKLEQGLQVIKIFKEHSSKQCILDDFEFYEDRQKRIQEKKAKQLQFQKQVWEGKEKRKEDMKVEEIVSPKSTQPNVDLP